MKVVVNEPQAEYKVSGWRTHYPDYSNSIANYSINAINNGIVIFGPISGLKQIRFPKKSKWRDRLSKIMSIPLDRNNEYFSSVDASVVSNVRDFLNQIDEDLLEYLDMEDILPTPYGTITLDFEKNNDTISIEIGESKIAFFTDFENKENIKLDGVNYRNSMIPPELRKAFSCL